MVLGKKRERGCGLVKTARLRLRSMHSYRFKSRYLLFFDLTSVFVHKKIEQEIS
jgi:hypothetical protein